jgi:hypothetical protein
MPEVMGICSEREVSPASRCCFLSAEEVDKACGISAAVDTEKEFEEVA